MLKTPREWEDEIGVTVCDPDGWRADSRSFNDPLGRDDFVSRMKRSTIRLRDHFVGWDTLE